MTTATENFSFAMSLVKDVIDNKKSVEDLRTWILKFGVLFDKEMLPEKKYREIFLDGNLLGFSDSCPLMPPDQIREVLNKFWANRFDYKFNFLPKELAEPAATLHGYKIGLQAGQLFNQRNKTQ